MCRDTHVGHDPWAPAQDTGENDTGKEAQPVQGRVTELITTVCRRCFLGSLQNEPGAWQWSADSSPSWPRVVPGGCSLLLALAGWNALGWLRGLAWHRSPGKKMLNLALRDYTTWAGLTGSELEHKR